MDRSFDPQLSKASVDLAALVEGLRIHPEARLCLHGPPGTGKTAFGHWLAKNLGRPLHVRRLSELLSMFVGGTEQQIAGAFREAREENAILLLDEIDALIADRGKAFRSWEITQVSETLMQLENYQGILVATTNRIDALDFASRRRFDLEISFGYLTPAQVAAHFLRLCGTLGLDTRSPFVPRLEISNATPGDFAALARQHRFRSFASADELAAALEEKCAAKADDAVQRTIGFRAC